MTVDKDDSARLTEQDWRAIAEIRRELDEEFRPPEPRPREPRRWSTVVVVLAFLAGALSASAGIVFTLMRPAHRTATPTRPASEVSPSSPPAALPGPTAPSRPPVAGVVEAPAVPTGRDETAETRTRREVRAATLAWLDAHRRADLDAQMRFYPARVPVFYRWRDVERQAVRAEKARVLGGATTIDLSIGEPTIAVEVPDRRARTRFSKRYVIHGPHVMRRGEVMQELRWMKTADGWKIVGERDAEIMASDRGSTSATAVPPGRTRSTQSP